MELPLFDYYDMHLYGLVVDNREEPEPDEPDEEPELIKVD
jgi:hypothetical protein